MIKITMDDLWKVSPGRYISTNTVHGMYLGKEDYGHVVWNGWEDVLIEEWNDEEEVVIAENKVDIDKLIDVQIGNITRLVNDGWTMDGGNFLNIEGELDKLRVYVEVQKIVGSK